MVMYAMSYGVLPFEGDLPLDSTSQSIIWTPANVYKLYQYIAAHPIRLPKSQPDGLDEWGQQLLQRLLESKPERRITLEQVWNHSWIKNGIINIIE